MAIKADEDLPPEVALVFRQAGRHATSVLEQGWSGAGIVIFHTVVESRRRYIALAEAAARTLDLERLAGALVVVTPSGIRIRRPS